MTDGETTQQTFIWWRENPQAQWVRLGAGFGAIAEHAPALIYEEHGGEFGRGAHPQDVVTFYPPPIAQAQAMAISRRIRQWVFGKKT